MKKILTAAQMNQVDQLTTEKYGISAVDLMENAALEVFNVLQEKFGESLFKKSFLVFCGKGNNGGDGAALSRILYNAGAKKVRAFLFGKIQEIKSNSARTNFERLRDLANGHALRGDISFEEVENPQTLLKNDFYQTDEVIIDAIFGTGLNRPLEGKIAEFIEKFNKLQKLKKSELIVSIDLPSGLIADSGTTDGVFPQADLTVTFTSPKSANCFAPAVNANGQLFVVDIGSPEELVENSESQLFLADENDVKTWLNKTAFTSDSYKTKRGNALVIAGSKQYAGAAVLATNACLLTGVGLVGLATPESAYPSISARLYPEAICYELEETKVGEISGDEFEKIQLLAEKADVLAVGCGLLKKTKELSKFIKELVLQRKTPMVLDAEAINCLSPFEISGNEENPLVLTPHQGEFLRLLGEEKDLSGDNRIYEAQEFAKDKKVILVLKGERSLIVSPEGKVVVSPTGSSGLGKGGNGDTLTGIITGFIAQTIAFLKKKDKIVLENRTEEVFKSVVAAVFLGGLAGEIAEKEFGKRVMRATDVQNSLSQAFRLLEK